jgi:hypothetical protein
MSRQIKFYMAVMLAMTASLAAGLLHAATAPQSFEPDSMARVMAGHKGKPFVLVIWSLDCAYCQASLKVLAQQQTRDKTLTVVTLATDAADPSNASVIANKLRATGIRSEAWAFGAASPEQLRYAIDPAWRGEIPRTYWYDAKGNRIAYSGLLTAELAERFLARNR